MKISRTLFALLAISCTVFANGATFATKPISKLSAFTGISASGFAKVDVASGPQKVTVVNKASPVQIKVHDHTLFVKAPLAAKAKPNVKVQIPEIEYLRSADSAHINAKNIHAKELVIDASEHGSIRIRGEIAVREIHQNGLGNINVEWVNTDNLMVRSFSPGQIKLAGTANFMQAKIYNNARLNAKYLRTRNIFILTRNNAVAEIFPINSLNAFAYDNSQIFYYKRARDINTICKQSANILVGRLWQ